MENNGQLTFSDDPFSNESNEIYDLIESGEFTSAIEKLDLLLSKNLEYPGLFEAYRTARFWENRKKDLYHMTEGQDVANFLMNQWNEFTEYSRDKEILESSAYQAIQKFVFFTAAEHYRLAFQNQQTPTTNFDVLLNLGVCFITLGEYQRTIETLEYAKSSYKVNARLLFLLAEAYFHTNETAKSLMYFREGFYLDPSEADLETISAKPIIDILEIIHNIKLECKDQREWIPIIGYISDIFYVKHQLNHQQYEILKKDIYNLEKNLQAMTDEQLKETNVVPRLINKYLWMYDYFKFQQYNFQNISEIRSRLIEIKKDLFGEYFKNIKE